MLSQTAKAGFLRRKLGRSERLRNVDVVSPASLDEAETDARMAELAALEAKQNLQIAQLELRRAEVALCHRTIRAPIDGVVVERALTVGEYRNNQTHLLTIAQMDPLRVEVILPIALYGQVKRGAKAEIAPEKPIGGQFTATVTIVDDVFDAASGTFGVRLALPNSERKLPAGLRCSLRFLPGSRDDHNAAQPVLQPTMGLPIGRGQGAHDLERPAQMEQSCKLTPASALATAPVISSAQQQPVAVPASTTISVSAVPQLCGKELAGAPFSPLQFEARQSSLSEEHIERLKGLTAILERCQQLRIEISGHTDASGSTSRNLEVSRQRAELVADFLSRSGVDRSRIAVSGFGSERPVAENDQEAGRAKNRRVELSISPL